MSSYGPRLLTPPQENEERSPYGPVWRVLVIVSGLLFIIVLVILMISNVLGVRLPAQSELYVNVGIVLTPSLIWAFLVASSERNSTEPRNYLFMTFVISALCGNAVGIPTTNLVFQVEKWLPLSSAIIRIVGYTVTVGILQELLKYLVLRYVVWPHAFRIRLDGVAYGIAAGIGYATVINLDFILHNSPVPTDAIALRVFANYGLHVSTGVVLGYGLAEVWFSKPNPFFMPIVLVFAALIIGITIPIRTGLVNSIFAITTPTPRPLLSLAFSAGLLITINVIVSALVNNADRRAEEAKLGEQG